MPRPEPGHTGYEHPQANHAKKKKAPPPFYIQSISAFYLFFAAALLGALFAPILDCDETFNYWEPTHYLSHGYGLQTWEYSPAYAIRSWLYVGIHAIVASVRRLLPHPTKIAEFYFVRYALAFTCALCQTLLWKTIAMTLHPRIGILFLLVTVISPGNFHSAAAYLPSSFTMYTTMLGVAAFMNRRGGLKTAQGIGWFAGGAVVGWPFAAALGAPFFLEEGIIMLFGGRKGVSPALVRIGRGVMTGLLVLAVETAVSSLFYRKPVVAAWNIVKYNVLSSSGGGAELYGTEPWSFYFRNLTLNFNIWFILALAAAPLFLLQKLVARSKQGFHSGLRTFVFLAPFYIWLAIFTLQPHKEERFMYPAYPLLALNAAVSTHIILITLGHTLKGKAIMARIKLLFVVTTMLLSIIVGLARIYGLYSAYSAPLTLYSPLWTESSIGRAGQITVCFGKEWYRFPTSFFLPNGMYAKFLQSEFRGTLPGEFSEASEFGFRAGTWLPTHGLNNRNEADPSSYVTLDSCHFLIDTQFPERNEPLPSSEPDYVADMDSWERVRCVPFMDASRTPALARMVWTPDLALVPEPLKRKWGRHCLLRRRDKGGDMTPS